MPSPLGHVIAGMAAGWLVAGTPGLAKESGRREAALYGALGALPDIDLLFGAHSGPTHSLGATAVVGLTAFVVARHLGAGHAGRLALACAAAYASHILLDWLGRDSSPPIGIMALWPVSRDYFESAFHLFMPISRRYDQGWTLVVQNAWAVCLEMVILVPILLLLMFLRPRRVEWERA